MHNTLDYNSTPLGFISGVCDLILLNLLFLLSSLPVFTIGAAVSGMYYVNLKTVRGEGGGVWKTYWKGFRENFKQATLFWLMFLGICILLAADFWVLPIMLPNFYQIPRIMVCMVFLAACTVMLYLFPILTRFLCTGKQALKNALLMMTGHFPWTLVLLVLHGIFPALCLLSEVFFLYAACGFLICGFSVINLTASHIFHKILNRYETS